MRFQIKILCDACNHNVALLQDEDGPHFEADCANCGKHFEYVIEAVEPKKAAKK